MSDKVLTPAQLSQLLVTATEAALSAAVPIQAYYAKQHLDVRQKSDGSPVTRADQEAEALIRAHLLSQSILGPLDILGEEEGLHGGGTRWRWTVDPIDGTRSFIHGIPLFGTLIALQDTETNLPLLGVIHLPMLGLTFSGAKGQGAKCQGKSLRVAPDGPIHTSIIAVGDIAQFTSAECLADYQRLITLSSYVRGYTDCFGHGLVLNGAVGAMLDPALNPWDILATQVLVEEAGGIILLRPSCIPGKVDALFGSPSLVRQIAIELSF
ncbi:MAG: inositol monophosphatase [Nitrospirales bacterium]